MRRTAHLGPGRVSVLGEQRLEVIVALVVVAVVVPQLLTHDELVQQGVHGLGAGGVHLGHLQDNALGADLPEVDVRRQLGA